MKANQILLASLAFAIIGSLSAQKRPTDSLIDSADAVVVGEALSGQQTGHSVVLSLFIERS